MFVKISSHTKLPPYALPILFFAAVILFGTMLLHHDMSLAANPISWVDALFTATSATCVTGLAVVDTGVAFSRFGHAVILGLIQVGGLGIMTFSSLFFYLLRNRISFTDRVAVGQMLLHDPDFHLGSFLKRIILWTFVIEACGALIIHLLDPTGFPFFSAIFHAISAFCNAGFSLHTNNLIPWQDQTAMNIIFIFLIIAGGIGFSVLVELQTSGSRLLRRKGADARKTFKRLSWYSREVLKTSAFLILVGWFIIFCAEFFLFERQMPIKNALLAALFQSVTCRTAGFNTVDIGQMSNVSLLFMIMLMFIGGAPGSCAGGIKVTTFRVLSAFVSAQFKGQRQPVVGRFAVSQDTLNNALMLMVFAVSILFTSSLLLNITETGATVNPLTRGLYLESLFEAVSAFGTVGLSTGLTPKLSTFGKAVIIMLMFIGRLGPIVFLATIQSYQKPLYYSWPEDDLLIG